MASRDLVSALTQSLSSIQVFAALAALRASFDIVGRLKEVVGSRGIGVRDDGGGEGVEH